MEPEKSPSVKAAGAVVKMKPKGVSESNSNTLDEPKPRLHAKTFLAVFAVCLIYFAQLVNLVGAGAVSPRSNRSKYHPV